MSYPDMKIFANTSSVLANVAVALALVMVLQGCDAIQRTEPSLSISQEQALSNPDAIQGLRSSMYSRFHSTALSTNWLLGPSSLADDTYFRLSQGRHQGFNLNVRGAGVGTGSYGIIYDTVNDANLLISGIEEGVVSEGEASKLEAEGLFVRSLVTHHAARTFGYEPGVTPASGGGSGFDLSVELRTEPTLDVSDATPTPRATASDVYAQLVDDLTRASDIFSNLPSDQVEGTPFFPSQAAAEALLARVHLYQRNWSGAETAAQNAIDLAASSFGSRLAAPSELDAIFDETAPNPEAIFTIDTDPLTETAGVNSAISAYTSQEWMAQIPTESLISSYEADDARLDAWYAPCFNEISGADPGGCDNINTQNLELQKYVAEQGQYADDYVHLRIAEMVLIQAEARLNETGVAAAINRLNDLREERGATALDPADYDFDSAYDAILAERRRELVAEGHRYFDLKRLGRDIQKSQGKLDTPAEEAFIPFEDFRILDDFPNAQLEINTELVQNPGYN